MRVVASIIISLIFLQPLLAAEAMTAEMSSAAAPVSSQTIRWKGSAVRLAISTSLTNSNPSIKADSNVMSALQGAVRSWESVSGVRFQIESSERQNASPAGVAGDGVSLITIASTPENLQLFAKNPYAESARTRVFFNRNGFITESDIVLNPLQQFSTDGTFGTFDLETVLTHELGHLLGLHHSAGVGALMSASISRNGAEYFGPRRVTDGDAAALRELYGSDDETCCGAVSGRIAVGSAGSRQTSVVWAEDSDGRTMRTVVSGTDGAYRLGGLLSGSYKLFSQLHTDGGGQFSALGLVSIDRGNTVLNSRAFGVLEDFGIRFVGPAGQPGDCSVMVRPGRTFNIAIAGKGLSRLVNLNTHSRFIHIDLGSLVKRDFGNDLDVYDAQVVIDQDAQSGVFALFAEDDLGTRSALPGALSVIR